MGVYRFSIKMKTMPSYLPLLVQRLFLCLEVLIVLLMILLTSMLFFGTGALDTTAGGDAGGSTTASRVEWTMANVGIRLEPEAYVVRLGTGESGGFELKSVRASLSTSNASAGNAYLRAVRPAMAALLLLVGLSSLLVCELFRRVFRQVANGESFTPANIRHVHRIGLLILVSTIAIALLQGWASHAAATFVRENVQVEGLQIDPTPDLPKGGIGMRFGDFPVSISLAGIFAGLIVLALGEAFRQGLLLKEDSELTV